MCQTKISERAVEKLDRNTNRLEKKSAHNNTISQTTNVNASTMRLVTILFSVLVACSSTACYAQIRDTLSVDTVPRRISKFSFGDTRIFLCASAKHNKPTDPRCFTSDIDCIGDVSYLRVVVVSHQHRKDTSYLTFNYSTTHKGLEFRSKSRSSTFVLDQHEGVIKHIQYDTSAANEADTSSYLLFRKEKLDSASSMVDEELRKDAASNISHTTWPNGQLRSRHAVISFPNKTYGQIDEYDSIGYRTMFVRIEDDSVLFGYYHNYAPGTGYVTESGAVTSVSPLRKTKHYSTKYEFDDRGNWTKKVRYDGAKKFETVTRKIIYASERPKTAASGKMFESWEIRNAYFSIFEFSDYSVVIDGPEEAIYAQDSNRKKIWNTRTRKLKLGEYFEKLMYVDREQNGKYDLKMTLITGDVILIKSRNGRTKKVK